MKNVSDVCNIVNTDLRTAFTKLVRIRENVSVVAREGNVQQVENYK